MSAYARPPQRLEMRTPAPPSPWDTSDEEDVLADRHCCACRRALAFSFGCILCLAGIASFLWKYKHVGAALGPPAGYCEEPDLPPLPVPNHSAAGITLWAELLRSELTFEEKRRLVRGVGWDPDPTSPLGGYYMGNVFAVPRLGIASINMHDGIQGFRPHLPELVGTSTAWPCALAIAAGWSADSTWRWAKAIGEEFKAKGANVVLGPSVNVHRVAGGGRNAEYISGEDPMLGAPLTAAYVRGAQEGAGVATVVKHFVLNQQETRRTSVDAHVDEQTLWEQYFPPFAAAVDAGVAAVMCSYNFVNGYQACSNQDTLVGDLKGRMGFQGWVMSDWWAIQSSDAAAHGTDMEMPGSFALFQDMVLDALPPDRLDDMVTRVLYGMASVQGVWSEDPPVCRVGCTCGALMGGEIAASHNHSVLARELATSGAVLLKNEPAAEGHPAPLPLKPKSVVALVGSACAAMPDVDALLKDWTLGDYYTIGGSGRVICRDPVPILSALQTSGLALQPSESDSVDDAAMAMQGADIVVICAGATSKEGTDRDTLKLDQDEFVNGVLDAAPSGIPTVLVALTAGAITAPWDRLSAAVAFFLSGQETGHAVADILTGAVTPSGKLPVTFPLSAEDALWPCQHDPCEYTEGLRGGWHVYDGKPVAFPFGHGLSYSSFNISAGGNWSVAHGGVHFFTVRVENTGKVSGAEVAQLYIGYPNTTPGQAQPPLRLRRFQKTKVLAPGDLVEIVFELGPHDLSTWDVGAHAWQPVEGMFTAVVGVSSRDHRLCGSWWTNSSHGTEMLPCLPGDVPRLPGNVSTA